MSGVMMGERTHAIGGSVGDRLAARGRPVPGIVIKRGLNVRLSTLRAPKRAGCSRPPPIGRFALISAVDKEIIDPDTVTTAMFGMRPEVRARRAAKAAARRKALGFRTVDALWASDGADAAARILAEAEGAEAHERDVVEASAREEAAVDYDDA